MSRIFLLPVRRRVFISYDHDNDSDYNERLLALNERYKIFIDASVDTRDISETLDDQTVRQKIRDEYLKDTTVTIVLVGLETKNRKHVDWEIYSSMFDSTVNKKSGILVINLPSTGCRDYTTAHDGEKERVYPETTSWNTIDSRQEYERRYPYVPDRIIDNLMQPDARISIVPWDRIENDPANLSFLIDATAKDRTDCNYDLSRPMRRANFIARIARPGY